MLIKTISKDERILTYLPAEKVRASEENAERYSHTAPVSCSTCFLTRSGRLVRPGQTERETDSQ